ncbi:MAG: copper resistance protein NlpE [Spirochaetaceae bacterium]|jgi:uncharacterized lipoprotein NlpE involved in copper resistance|nr:copper resistance protein NlpE [Spirochaetaceae bacterium]
MKWIMSIAICAIALAVFGSCGSAGRSKTGVSAAENGAFWAGVYTGTLPAADCPGIDVTIELYGDNTYVLVYDYIGREDASFTVAGTFTWDEAWRIITLNDSGGGPPYYFAGERRLLQLDMTGNVITGSLGDRYILEKVSE